MKQISKQNVLAGGLMLVTGLLIVFVLIPMGVVEPRKVKFAALSPSYYPRIVAVCLSVLGAAIIMKEFLQRSVTDDPELDRHPNAFGRTVLFFGVLVFLALTVAKLGFILACAVSLFVAMLLAGERRLWLMALIAILLPLFLHFFFLKVAGVPIPAGVLTSFLKGI